MTRSCRLTAKSRNVPKHTEVKQKGPQDSRCVDREVSGQLHAPAALPWKYQMSVHK